MLKKLSNSEKANFYKAVADMENNYGLQRVEDAMRTLCETLDGKRQPLRHEQIELLPFETGPEPETLKPSGSRIYKGSKPRGENERIMQKYFEDHKKHFMGVESLEELIVKMYYKHGDNQYKIAENIGVNQRAISAVLQGVSEKKKRALIARWEEGRNIGHK